MRGTGVQKAEDHHARDVSASQTGKQAHLEWFLSHLEKPCGLEGRNKATAGLTLPSPRTGKTAKLIGLFI